jgi:hypothetical protein
MRLQLQSCGPRALSEALLPVVPESGTGLAGPKLLEAAEETDYLDQMLKQTLLWMLLSTTAAAEAAGGTNKLSVNLAGVGARTCAYWLSDKDRKSEGTVWIYGFWSSLNYVAAASEQKQSQASSGAMIAAVEKLCRREPSRVLAAAAWSAYIDLNEN